VTLLPLTTVERVKRRMGDTDPTPGATPLDQQIDTMILSVSQAFQNFIDPLSFYVEERTEVYSVHQFAEGIWLRSYFGRGMPVPTVSSLKVRSHFSSAWADVSAQDSGTYALSSQYPGLLLYNGNLPQGEDTVQVVYTAGFAGPYGTGETIADTTDVFIETFPVLADAADAQVVWEFRRRKEPGQSSISVEGSTSTQQGEVNLLKIARDRLALYRPPQIW